MVGRDGEEGHLDPALASVARRNLERKASHRLRWLLARLKGHGAVSITVDVPLGVTARDHFEAALPEDRSGGSPEELLASAVPEHDPIGRVDGENRLLAPGDSIEGLGR
jgi:hypothetical protein